MKQAKRLIVAFLCLALVLTGTLLVVVACGEEGYSITASFNSQEGTVTYTDQQQNRRYAADEQVTVTVTPNENYQVQSFKVNGDEQPLADGTYTFNITQNTEIVVTFEPTDTDVNHVLTYGLGAHAASGATAPAQESLAQGETTSLPQGPSAEQGWEFGGWSDGTQTYAAGATFTMPGDDVTLTAQWNSADTPTTYTLTVEKTENGSVEVDPEEGPYPTGTEITVTATPDPGYEIYTFMVNDAPVNHKDGVYSFTITENTTITVYFTQSVFQTYSLRTEINVVGTGTITVQPQKTEYIEGDEITVTFVPAQNYTLNRFTVQGVDAELTDEQARSYTFNIADNTVIRAYFKATETTTSLPDYFYGQWTQINPLGGHVGKVEISATEFKYNDDIKGEQTYQVVQTPEGYAYKNDPFTTYFGFFTEDHDVLYIHMGGTLFYLFTADGTIPDKTFPTAFNNTKWDSENMGRISFELGKAKLDGNNAYLLDAEQDGDAYTLHVLYNGGYWILTYTLQDKSLTFAQPGGQGQDRTYILLEAKPLPDEYKGTWTIVGNGEDLTVDSDGYLHYRGEIRDVMTAGKVNYAYEFTIDDSRFGLGVLYGTQMLFVLDFADDNYELYCLQGTDVPNSTVGLPDDYNGDWVYQPSGGDKLTLHIEGGTITINGQQVKYWGEEIQEEGYIARAVYDNSYWDVIISSSMVEFGSVMFDHSANKDKWDLQFRREGSAGVTFPSTFVGRWTQLGGDNVIVIGDDTFSFNGTNCTGASLTWDTYKITGALNATVSLWEEGYYMNALLKVETDSGTFYYENGTPSTSFPTDWRGKTFTSGEDTVIIAANGNATLNGNALRLIDYTLSYSGSSGLDGTPGTPDTGFAYDEVTKTLYIITFNADGGFTLSDLDGNNTKLFTPSV